MRKLLAGDVGLGLAVVLWAVFLTCLRSANLIATEHVSIVATVIGGLLASYYGAKKAMDFQEAKEHAQQLGREVDALNSVLLALSRRIEGLENLNQQVVAPVRNSASRHLDMQRLVAGLQSWPLSLEHLSPMLKHTRAANAILAVARSDKTYQDIQAILSERDSLYRELAERTSNAGLRMERQATGEEIRQMVGERVWFTLMGVTDLLIAELDDARPKLVSALQELCNAADEIYPRQPIIKVAFPVGGDDRVAAGKPRGV